MDSDKILSVRFNQDQGCFSCAMESGARIYNVDPLVEKCYYDLETVGSIGLCEMLYRTNIIAFVSGGSRPKYSDNVLQIFDDLIKKVIVIIEFRGSIQAIRLRKDKIVVALLTDIYVYSHPAPVQRLFTIQTTQNPRGLLELSSVAAGDKQLLIFPGQKVGSVQILDIACTEVNVSMAPVWISAHKGVLACVAFNPEATKIATASVQGTLIRIWDVATKAQLMEFRRGSDPATIYCLSFNDEYLCCTSDKGTGHIFAVKEPGRNKTMPFKSTHIFGNYANSQWALARFSVPQERPSICGFIANNCIVAVSEDGTYRKYVFNPDGNCNRDAYVKFLDADHDHDFCSY